MLCTVLFYKIEASELFSLTKTSEYYYLLLTYKTSIEILTLHVNCYDNFLIGEVTTFFYRYVHVFLFIRK